METPLWERVKENAAPLEQGRDVFALERTFAADTEEDRQEKDRMIQHYERLVAPSETPEFETGENDPIIHWQAYIKFHQDYFPSQTHAQFLIFERCIRALARFQKYANDVRFVRICCSYADKTDNPSDIFQHLYKKKIGSELSMFYMAWAFVAEKQQQFSFAEQIFQKGIRKKARPAEKLLQRHQQFQRRMARYWMNSTQQEVEEDHRARGVLGSLSEDSVRHNDRSSRATQNTFTDRARMQQPCVDSRARNKASFSIFVETDRENRGNILDDSLHTDRELEREHDRRKENTLYAEPWNQRGSLRSSYMQPARVSARSTSPAPFAVYIDEECAAQHAKEERDHQQQLEYHRQRRDDRTFREREDGVGVAEKLVKDPLRYIRDPTRYASDSHEQRKDKKKHQQSILKTQLLTDLDGNEQCVEEARANAEWFRIMSSVSNINEFLMKREIDQSLMSLDGSEDFSNRDSTGGSCNICGRPPLNQKLPFTIRDVSNIETNEVLQSQKYDEATPQNISYASSTIDDGTAVGLQVRNEPTINTQLALKELSMMFSSPAMGGADDSNAADRSGGIGPILDESGVSETVIPTITEGLDDEQTAKADDLKTIMREVEGAVEQPKRQCSSFAIFDENNTKNQKPCVVPKSFANEPLRNSAGGDTATFASFENLMMSWHREMEGRDPNQVNDRFSVDLESQNAVHVGVLRNQIDTGNGDTATFSLYGDVMEALGEFNTENDDDDDDELLVSFDKSSSNHVEFGSHISFGDISRIVHLDEPTATSSVDRVAISNACFQYDDIHSRDVKDAAKRLLKRSTCKINNLLSFEDLLSQSHFICDLPAHVMPSVLKSKQFDSGKIKINQTIGNIRQELGRGMYGVVVLLDTSAEQGTVALKAQGPADCLAWEYEILEKVEQRVGQHLNRNCFPYPRPMSYISFADGALLSMSASSSSGLNLVDLVNVYGAKLNEKVPEIIVLHYASRMLHHIEYLHWHGKILHCDTKPDNWVLTESSIVLGDTIKASDLTLVDFGRAVDLTTLSTNDSSILDTMLVGEATVKDMMCVAMRKGYPWSFDIDTFGICSAIHVMLFGCHLSIEVNTQKRWMPAQSFRRYHQADLWCTVFETLLNMDNGSAICSHPRSLRELRYVIEEYIKKDNNLTKLRSALNRQAALVPEKRIT